MMNRRTLVVGGVAGIASGILPKREREIIGVGVHTYSDEMHFYHLVLTFDYSDGTSETHEQLKPSSEYYKDGLRAIKAAIQPAKAKDIFGVYNFWEDMARCIEETPDPPKPKRCS